MVKDLPQVLEISCPRVFEVSMGRHEVEGNFSQVHVCMKKPEYDYSEGGRGKVRRKN